MNRKISKNIKAEINLCNHIETCTGHKFKKEGKTLSIPCPFCQSKSGFKMNLERLDVFNCFSCGRCGTIIDFEKELYSLSDGQAIEKLAQAYNLTPTDISQIQQEHVKLTSYIWDKSNVLTLAQAKKILTIRGYGKLVETGTTVLIRPDLARINTYKDKRFLIFPQSKPNQGIVGIHKIAQDLHSKRDIGAKVGMALFQTIGGKGICLIVESFFNGFALYLLGYDVIIMFGKANAHALENWLPKAKERTSNICFWLDRGAEQDQQKLCIKYALKGIWFEEQKPNGFDVNDLLKHNSENFEQSVAQYVAKANQIAPQLPSIATEARNAKPYQSIKNLEQKQFPPLKFSVGDMLPEGLTIFGGKAKMGKSAAALNMALAVALGGKAFGKIDVAKADVLYIDLESGERRLKQRTQAMLQGQEFPDNLYYATKWKRLDNGGLLDIESFLQEHPNTALVVIDVFGKVRPAIQKYQNMYDYDYMTVTALKELADQYHVSIMVLHHTRKADGGDVFDDLSGSSGLTGAADSVWILKRGRGQGEGTLNITSRDIEEKELAMSFKFPQWDILGNAAEFKLSQERQAILSVLKEGQRPMTPKEITEQMAVKGIERRYEAIAQALSRMVRSGEIKSGSYGKYHL